MFRKMLFAILVVLLTLSPTNTGITQAETPTENKIAYIKNDETGLIFDVPVAVEVTDTSITYQAPITNGMLTEIEKHKSGNLMSALDLSEQAIVPLASGGGSTWQNDPSVSVRLTLYMQYRTATQDGNLHAAAEFYKGKWERLDPTVTVTKFNFTALCYGENWIMPSAGNCETPKTKTASKTNPANNTYYVHDPNWDNLYVYLTDVHAHTDKLKATMIRGSTQWTFTICIGVGGPALTNCVNLIP